MPEAVIVAARRTPIGTAGKGSLRDTDAFDLAEHIVSAVAARGAGRGDPARNDHRVLGG
ncbi:MAG TPA: acetyl-CoA C-acyltransferase, partial [Gordonia sp. (in: high G+C Gram-positive bacteria)]|nr:acetyl-CoA C-acyltransferase [Gordonia sp. (in: high G+C Gram-positive bacteria)]